MADFNLGTARGTIEIDSSGAEAGVDKATKSVAGLNQGMDKASGTMIRTGAALGGIGVAAVAGFGFAVNAAANFEERISAVSNATEADLESFRQLALQLGADTKFGAGEAAGAIEELAKAGVQIPDILNGAAKAVTDLAAAGAVDLTRAAEITANAMNAFSIKGEEAGRVADVFAVAANSSAADVDTLGQSLAQVSAVAATVGLTFEDTIAALELFANKGLKGSDAGTSLKTALLNLQPTTEKQINLFKELGLLTDENAGKLTRLGGEVLNEDDLFNRFATTSDKVIGKLEKAGLTLDKNTGWFRTSSGAMADFGDVADIIATKAGLTEKEFGALGLAVNKGGNAFFDAQGKLKPLVEIQAALQNATKGMTDAQKLATFEMIGGSDAVRALSIIAGDTTGQLAGLRGELTSQGQAGDTAAKRMDNLKGSMEQLRGSVETALIKIGQAGQGPIRAVVDFLTKLVNGFTNLSPQVQQFIIVGGLAVGILIGMAGAFLLVGGGILKVIQVYKDLRAAVAIFKSLEIATKAWTAAQAAFNAVMALNPIFLIVAGLVLLGAALFIAYQRSESFRNVIDAIGRAIVTAFGFILNLGAQVVSFFTNNWQTIIGVLFPFIGIPALIIANWSKIIDFFQALPGKLAEIFLFIVGFAIGFSIRMIGIAMEFGYDFIEAVLSFFIQLPGRISDILISVATATASWVVDMLGKAVDLGSRFLNALVEWFQQLPGRIAEFLGNMIMDARTWGSIMVSNARETASNFWNGLVDGIQGLPGVVLGILDRVIDAFLGVINRAWSAAKSVASALWNGFKAGLGIGSPSLIEYAMWDLVDNVGSSIKDLKGQIGTIQKMSGLDWGGNVGLSASAIPPGTLSSVRGAVNQASGAITQATNTFQNTFHTDADPIAISNQIMWDQRVRVRGA